MAHIGMWDRRGGWEIWSLDSPFDLLISFLVLCTWRRPIEGFDSDSLGNTCIWSFRDIISRLREFSSITYSLHSSSLAFSTAFFSVAFHPSLLFGIGATRGRMIPWYKGLAEVGSSIIQILNQVGYLKLCLYRMCVEEKKFIFPSTKSLARPTY